MTSFASLSHSKVYSQRVKTYFKLKMGKQNNSNNFKRKVDKDEVERNKMKQSKRSTEETTEKKSDVNKFETISSGRRLLQQTENGRSSVSANKFDSEFKATRREARNMNQNSSKVSAGSLEKLKTKLGRIVDSGPGKKFVKPNDLNKKSVRRSLADELDEIDAEFEQLKDDENIEEVLAPDGIRISVNREEENEFPGESDDQLDFDEEEDEEIFPLPKEVDMDRRSVSSDADTVVGEELADEYNSVASSAVVIFKHGPSRESNIEENAINEEEKVINDNVSIGNVAGKKVSEMSPNELMEANPALKELMIRLVNKPPRRTQSNKRSATPVRKTKSSGNPQSKERTGDKRVIVNKGESGGKMSRGGGITGGLNLTIKSPSDTTIYAPALKLTPENQHRGVVEIFLDGNREWLGTRTDDNLVVDRTRRTTGNNEGKITEQNVSMILDQIREGANRGRQDQHIHDEPQPGTSSGIVHRDVGPPRVNHDMTMQSERYKARTEIPRGNEHCTFLNTQGEQANGLGVGIAGPPLPVQANGIQPQTGIQGNQMYGIMDDEFFHLTCHVEPNLKVKIERGEFVELEKLLPKDRYKNQSMGQRMELVTRGSETFIMPVDRESKITNVRRWEQAFRIYAAIYSQANPQRSAEIWQYVFVINSAASTYVWENVASYDFTFRQLMACNPGRSWANIYLQMWNLTMRDVLPRNNQITLGEQSGSMKTKRKGNGNGRRPSYCWSYNRGEKCKFDPNCRFVRRCSYCDGGHPQIECPKLKDKKGK